MLREVAPHSHTDIHSRSRNVVSAHGLYRFLSWTRTVATEYSANDEIQHSEILMERDIAFAAYRELGCQNTDHPSRSSFGTGFCDGQPRMTQLLRRVQNEWSISEPQNSDFVGFGLDVAEFGPPVECSN
jgi:type II secretory pathway component PulJ